jgi:hypothetical protein
MDWRWIENELRMNWEWIENELTMHSYLIENELTCAYNVLIWEGGVWVTMLPPKTLLFLGLCLQFTGNSFINFTSHLPLQWTLRWYYQDVHDPTRLNYQPSFVLQWNKQNAEHRECKLLDQCGIIIVFLLALSDDVYQHFTQKSTYFVK